MAKKVFTGKVASNKMTKTVVVEIERKVTHPVYQKIMKRTNRLKADVNGFEPSLGAFVRIEQSKPMSHGKNFKVVEVLNADSQGLRKGGK